MKHFILTRFNVRLWTQDKQGNKTQTEEWLKHRFSLFEQYCLPSVQRQSKQSFQWIVLFDANTPDTYKKRIEQYRHICKQFCPYYIESDQGRYFARIFRKIVEETLKDGERCITTYLDNDDALRLDYVEEVYRLAETAKDKTFIVFKYGLQYFTSLNIATCIPYRNNHFISFVERYTMLSHIRTVFGYGSHINIGSYAGTEVLRINEKEKAMWVEVIHETNMDNDVKMTLDTTLITDNECLQKKYGIDRSLSPKSRSIFYTQFMVRAIKEIVRHVRLRIMGRKWV